MDAAVGGWEERMRWAKVSTDSQGVWRRAVGRGCGEGESGEGGAAETEPVQAAEAEAVAGETEIVVTRGANRAVVVERVFDVRSEAASAGDGGLGVEDRART